jgi:hypothetical protein
MRAMLSYLEQNIVGLARGQAGTVLTSKELHHGTLLCGFCVIIIPPLRAKIGPRISPSAVVQTTTQPQPPT